MSESTLETSCSKQHYDVRESDLPLSCPMPNVTQWDGHPKVYLDIQTKGEVKCPYCGALYTLVE